MLKVLIMIDCDSCRSLFQLSHFASTDVTAWSVHGDKLVQLAESNGWSRTCCGNFHYCPTCAEELEEYEQRFCS